MSTSPQVNPLGYQGVHSQNPPMLWFRDRNPDSVTFTDFRNYTIGDEWQNTATKQFFKLVDKPTGQGIWSPLTQLTVVSTITGDDGVVIPAAGSNFNFYGGIDHLGGMEFTASHIFPGTIDGWVHVDGVTTTINGANELVAIAAGGFVWTVINVNTIATASNGYIINGPLNVTLPATGSPGDTIKIVGLTGGWTIDYAAGQIIHFFDRDATLTTGTLASTHPSDCVELVCTVTDTDWSVVNSGGNITVT
jgi:hypothetical protein